MSESSYLTYREAAGEPRLALFTSPSCAPCRALKPLLQAVCDARGVQLQVFDAASERETVMRLGLRSVPAVILCSDWGERVLFTGAAHEDRILRHLVEAGVIDE